MYTVSSVKTYMHAQNLGRGVSLSPCLIRTYVGKRVDLYLSFLSIKSFTILFLNTTGPWF